MSWLVYLLGLLSLLGAIYQARLYFKSTEAERKKPLHAIMIYLMVAVLLIFIARFV